MDKKSNKYGEKSTGVVFLSGVLAKFRPVQTTPFSLSTKIKIIGWIFIRSTLFRWSPTPVRSFRRSLLRLFGAKLSATVSIHNTCRIDFPWNLEMGPYASLGEYAWVYALGKISIGEYSCIGQHAKLITGTHDIHDPLFSLVVKPITIEYGCWLAVGVTVLPGVKIGDLAVVGAGSVVTKDLPGQMVCVGNPCKPIKKREFKSSC